MPGTLKTHGLLYKYKSLDKSYTLNSPSPTERGELKVLKDINSYIVNQKGPIKVKIGKFIFENIFGANKVSGTPKADIALVSYNEQAKKFVDVAFISHKMGQDAGGFQQYSGITPKADGTKTGAISNDKTVQKFLTELTVVHKTIVNKKIRYFRKIKDDSLIGKSIYGPLFGSKTYGVDNIHVIGQGDIELTKERTHHTLKFSTAMSVNPDVSEFKSDDYTAIIGARFSNGRNYEVNNKTYKNVRVLIMPKKLIGSKAVEI